MTQRLHLWPEEPRQLDDQVEVSARFEQISGKPKRIYFRLPLEERTNLTPAADSFVLAVTFHALRAGADLEVHGVVSPSLLRGLEEFQAAWSRWRPDRYRPFEVTAEGEREEAREASGRTVMAFSGGLDSCCTAWRHTQGGLLRRKRRLEAALMVLGFDIPVDQKETFARAAEASRAILDSIDVRLVTMTCNVRDLMDDWEDAHGAALAACLHLLSRGYSTGLVASSHVYETLRLPWGSNPITDPLLSSDSFSIVQDSCDLTRWEKADEIGDWDAALRNLRICWEGEHLDRNCGVCTRCVVTALCFYAVRRPPPPSLPVASPEEGLARLRALRPSPVLVRYLDNLARTAQSRGITEPWVAALEPVARRFRRQLRGGWRALLDRLR